MPKIVCYPIRFIALLFIPLFAGIITYAAAGPGIETYQHEKKGKFKQGDTLIVKDEKFENSAVDWSKINNRKVTNIITLSLDKDEVNKITQAFSAEMKIKIEYWAQPNQADPGVLDNIKLKVTYDPTTGASYQASSDYHFDNSYKVQITIEDFTSAELGDDLPAAFHLMGQVIVERTYEIDNNTPIVTHVTMGPSNSTAYQASLTWNKLDGAQEYDLEWTFIYSGTDFGRELNTSYPDFTVPMVQKMFKNNATRVTVQQEYYDITQTSYNSFILIRIRPVHYDDEGYRIEGDWNYGLERDGNTFIGAMDIPSAGRQSNFNWTYDAAYAEDGKRKEVIHFLDGSLRERQAVTLSNTEQKAIVQETLYDEVGRPVVNIMPAPVNNNSLKYYKGLHPATDGNTYDYSYAYGNNTDCIATPAPLGTTGYDDVDNSNTSVTVGGAGQYYSPENVFYNLDNNSVNKYTPDAGGYPFSVTRYTSDNTNRVTVKGSVGALFQPGPDQTTSKAVRIYYGTPDQWELDRLFGNDVGFASHYLKTMTVDGNGQIGISYANASGKVIASALAGDAPEGLDELPGKPATHEVTAIIIDTSQFKFDAARLSMSAVKTYLNAVPGPVTITYNIAQLIKTYEENSVKICSNCYYELNIQVTDDCNEVVYHNESPIPVGSLTSNCSNTAVSTGSIPATFGKAGPYYITFTLGLSQTAIDNYTSDFVSSNTNLRSQWSFVYPTLNEKDFDACFNDCATCLTSLGTKADFVSRVVTELTKDANLVAKTDSITQWAGVKYDALYSQCQLLQSTCGTSPCDDMMHLMLQDVSPNGQYALFDESGSPLESGINVLYNNWRTVFPIINNPSNVNYQKNLVELGNGLTSSANDPDFTLAMLVEYWKSEWATLFLPYHPEYCALQFCQAYGVPESWDDRLKNVVQSTTNLNTILPGVTYSRTDASWLVNNDPFFTTYAPDYKSRVISDLANYTTVMGITGVTTNSLANKTLQQYVDYIVYCADGDGNINSVNQGGGTTSDNWSYCTPVESCRIPDVEFRTYRELYLELKQRYYQEIRSANYCGSACTVDNSSGFVFSSCAKVSDFVISESDVTLSGCTGKVAKITYTGIGLPSATTVQFYYPAETVVDNVTYVTGITFEVGQTERVFCVPDNVPVNTIRVSNVICNNSGSNSGDGGDDEDTKWDCANWKLSWFSPIYNSQDNPKSIGVSYIGAETIPTGKYTYVVVKATVNGVVKYGAIRIDATTLSGTWSPENPNNQYSLLDYGMVQTQCTSSVIAFESSSSARLASTASTTEAATTTASTATIATTEAASTCDEAYKYKISRVTNISFGGNMNIPSTAAALTDSLNLQLATMVHSNCETMADDWMTKLDACLNSNSTYLAKKATLKAALIEICAAGGDTSHLYGASTTPNGTLVGGYSSFKDAIKGILGLSTFSMICNPWLIDAPYPYSVQMQASDKIVSKTNFAICNKVSSLKIASGTATGDNDGFYTWLKNRFGDGMTLSKDELITLQNGCGNCRFLLTSNIKLPVFFDGYAKGEANYWDYNDAVSAFNTDMGGSVDVSDANYRDVFTNYMNQRWGFTLTYDDYVDYKAKIDVDISAILLNKVAYPTVTEDPYACMVQQVNDAAATGYVLYHEYIDEVKRIFRKEYIAYCGSVKPTVKLTSQQAIYHHTLYYYDQAGNLVRTVPPEGVHLVDESLFNQIDKARINVDPVCNYTGPITNSSVDSAKTALTNVIGLGTNSAMEFWMYKPNGGSVQFVTTTGSSKYLVNVCLDGRYAHLDIYGMTVSGGTVDLTSSHHTDADMQAVLPLGQWTHIVFQGYGLDNDNRDVYINGVKCPVVTNATTGGCGWELSSGSSTPVYPQDLGYVKHMRVYSRLMTEAEIAANAADPCLGISIGSDVALKPGYWFKYNTPTSGAGSVGSGITETSVTPIYPTHTLATSYAYQSLNKATLKVSPDGGKEQHWFDYLGRDVASQNAEQLSGAKHGYSTFDEQNRVIEEGEKSNGNTLDNSLAFVPTSILTAFESSGTNGQITRTLFDKQYEGFGYTQENLHKRIAARSYQDGTTSQQVTYYSYDQIGNVKTMWQQIEGLETKQIEYNYDLAAGKVNKLRYQYLNTSSIPKTDQFYYGYEYDADNRVVKAVTGINSVSTDGWEIENPHTDAHYSYYLHGPLSRTELGNKQLVQGIDYAYTLQGQPKVVNGQFLGAENDMGKDGLADNVHSVVGPDVFGYTLDYYTGDYTPIGNAGIFPLTWQTSSTSAAGHNLYNGNVGRATVSLSQFGNTVGYSYRYDQLNRLKAMRQHPLTIGATSWDASTAGTAYQEDVTYDANGNILTYNRNGSGANGKQAAMDELIYGYNRDASGYLLNNQLAQVKDDITTTDYSTDVKSQSDNNYGYDKIGNLVKDVQAGISDITWTVTGKIKKIIKSDGSTIEYKYDADGNRVYKVYTHGTQVDKTWYVRDAKGVVLAIYGNKDGDTKIYWKEQQLTGFSRLGSWNPDLDVSAGSSGTVWGASGKKLYELSNNLGNVVATVSDELTAENGAFVVSSNDYYPFGMMQPDRDYSTSSYRYGFNGQEKSNEIKGEGNIYTAQFWEYDPRVGRRWNVDPRPDVSYSPYAVMQDNPIWYNDPAGDTGILQSGSSSRDNPTVVGTAAHEALSTYLNQQNPVEWYTSLTLPSGKKPDVVNGLLNQVWELKPTSYDPWKNKYAKYLKAKSQIEAYVAELNLGTSFLGGGTFRKGTDKAWGIPINNGRQLWSRDGSYVFTYYIDNPTTGLIYYNARKVQQKPQPSPVTSPADKKNPLKDIDLPIIVPVGGAGLLPEFLLPL
ncbi:hypothetical protein SIO70_02370 [Chitinophaga sancti]|uniref:RHS repeat domain-containing protein n=1 Tax=Chitinophaga sancti TaxID=1004 RepID=UPI002A75FB86|nr:hypothetical protein [Chitinophaga sancti]WPQ63704.1 hypothetical protein SIO70_02370 [Chitinophaga sancti]